MWQQQRFAREVATEKRGQRLIKSRCRFRIEGGDAGGILRQSKNFPYVSFVRSQYSGKQISSILYSEVGQPAGNSKQMRNYLVTTGIIVAYKNTFQVHLYNI